MAPFVGRFAPSPTGLLHLGNARTALLGWLQARSVGGLFLLRIEDLDPERSRAEYIDAIFRDLEYLGLDWDGPVVHQSTRGACYRASLERLRRDDHVYWCTCSRADIARAASAPHAGEEGPIYPGTCRDRLAPPAGLRASLRFRAAPGEVSFDDGVRGTVHQDVAASVGDFIVQRGDGVASYQLAVVVDDAEAGITDVLRGDDLLSSTPRQIQLFAALGAQVPRFHHVPLLALEGGGKLSKRDGATTIRGLRERGLPAEALLGTLARWSGLGDGRPVRARELVSAFSIEAVSKSVTAIQAPW
jgi:glutamyl-tRNA synthetase